MGKTKKDEFSLISTPLKSPPDKLHKEPKATLSLPMLLFYKDKFYNFSALRFSLTL